MPAKELWDTAGGQVELFPAASVPAEENQTPKTKSNAQSNSTSSSKSNSKPASKPNPMHLDEKRVKEVVPEKTTEAFKTISEVAAILELPQYVLRFWETKFKQIKPLKMRGGRRYYRPEDIEVLQTIKHLLYKDGYTIKGAKNAFDNMKKEAAKEKPARTRRKKAAPLLQPTKPAQPSVAEVKKAKKKQELAAIQQELLDLKGELADAD